MVRFASRVTAAHVVIPWNSSASLHPALEALATSVPAHANHVEIQFSSFLRFKTPQAELSVKSVWTHQHLGLLTIFAKATTEAQVLLQAGHLNSSLFI
jgi:hypothetical protein